MAMFHLHKVQHKELIILYFSNTGASNMTATWPSSCPEVTVSEEFHQNEMCSSSSFDANMMRIAADSNTSESSFRRSEKENVENKSLSDTMNMSTATNERLDNSGRISDAKTVSCSSTSCVSFGSIHVREYNRSLGEISGVSHGLAIGWEFIEKEPVPVDDTYRESKQKRKKKNALQKVMGRLGFQTKSSRRKKPARDSLTSQSNNGKPIRKQKRFDQRPTTIVERSAILQNFGFTWADLAEAEEQRAMQRFEQFLAMY